MKKMTFVLILIGVSCRLSTFSFYLRCYSFFFFDFRIELAKIISFQQRKKQRDTSSNDKVNELLRMLRYVFVAINLTLSYSTIKPLNVLHNFFPCLGHIAKIYKNSSLQPCIEYVSLAKNNSFMLAKQLLYVLGVLKLLKLNRSILNI